MIVLLFLGAKKWLCILSNLEFICSFVMYEAGETFVGNNMFYFLIKGQVKIQSPFYQKSLSGGMFFGHLELLTSCP